MSKLGDEHRALLRRALDIEGLTDRQRSAFDGMLRVISGTRPRYETLSADQASWLRKVLASIDGPELTRLTDGPVPRGRPVPVPEVLRRPLPLAPPGRKVAP